MQDGINSNANIAFNSNYNNYTYMYYTNSQAKTTLESWYQTNIGSKKDLASSVASGAYYCEQAKVKLNSILPHDQQPTDLGDTLHISNIDIKIKDSE